MVRVVLVVVVVDEHQRWTGFLGRGQPPVLPSGLTEGELAGVARQLFEEATGLEVLREEGGWVPLHQKELVEAGGEILVPYLALVSREFVRLARDCSFEAVASFQGETCRKVLANLRLW